MFSRLWKSPGKWSRPRRRPRLERLEAREVLSGGPLASGDSYTLPQGGSLVVPASCSTKSLTAARAPSGKV